jgi:hypothetical protein
MAEKTVISIEVDGVQKSINSVKELKDSISDLQKIAENADIGSERQKEAVKQIDNLNSQLKQLTQTEEQYAKSLEDVAKAEKEAIKETQDLRKQFEVLEDELFLLAGQGKQNTKEFRNLTIEAAALNKKIDAVNSSLGENSAGRASAGFSQLSDGLKNLDFDSVKKGLAVMKTALAATGIMLLVQGVMYLYENFEELSKGSGVLAKVLRGVGDAISYVKNFVTDLVGATTESSRALEKQGEDMVKANEKSQEALQGTTSEFDRQLAVAKAAGKSTIEIEQAKQQAIIDTNFQIAKGIEAQVRAGGEFTDEMKKQLSGSLEAIKNAKVKEYEITENDNKAKQEQYKKHLEEKLIADKKRIEDINNLEINDKLRRESDLAIRVDLDKLSGIKKLEEKELELQGLQGLEETYRQIDLENLQAWNEKNKQLKQQETDASLQISAQGLTATQNLSDAFFAIKMANVKKGSKEEDEAARKQFKTNKAIQISLAIISGVQGVLNALSAKSILPEPFATGVRIANAVVVGTAAAASVAKISAMQFQSSSDFTAPSLGGGAASSAGMPSTNGTPSIAAPQQNTTTFTGNNNNNFNQPPIKTYVVETDLRNSTNTIDKIKDQATF